MSKKKEPKLFAGFRIDPELKEKIDDYCALRKITFSSLMENLASEFIKEHPLTQKQQEVMNEIKALQKGTK